MLDKKAKQRVIDQFKIHDTDTGSSEVQIAILSFEIKELVKHLRTHRKDHSSRRGLLRKIGERRRLLSYLKKENLKSWEDVVKRLKLKAARDLEAKDDVVEEELAEELGGIASEA